MAFLQRKQRLVHKQIQWGAVAFIFFITLAILAFHTWITYVSVAKATEISRTHLTRLLVQDVAVTMLFMGAFVVFLGVLGTHKLAGPIYRFQETLKQMQKGDISEVIRLRNGDMLMDFMGDLNLALANLREIAAEDRGAIDEARFHLERAVKPSLSGDEARQAYEAALAALNRVNKRLILVKGAQAERTQVRRIVPGLLPAGGGAAPLAPPPPPPGSPPAGPRGPAVGPPGGGPGPAPAGPLVRVHAHSAQQRTVPFQASYGQQPPAPLPHYPGHPGYGQAASPAHAPAPHASPPHAPAGFGAAGAPASAATAEGARAGAFHRPGSGEVPAAAARARAAGIEEQNVFQGARTVAAGMAPPSAAELEQARQGRAPAAVESVPDTAVLQSARTVVAPMAPPSAAELARARQASQQPVGAPHPPVAPVDIANARTIAEPVRSLTREQAIRRLEDGA